MNCVLYARVSTDKQAEKDLSIPAQLRLMREFARQQAWTVIEELIEPGESATTADRPVFQNMLARIQEGSLKVDVVLAHKLNRLARNLDDYVPVRSALAKLGVRLAYVVEHIDSSPTGRLLENMMASIAQFESANLSEETKKGMRQRVLDGGWPHRPPRGYVMVKRTDSQTRGSLCEIHPREGPLVAKAFELFASGQLSVDTVASKLATEGLVSASGTPLAHSLLRQMLTNPFYIGRIHWKDLRVAGVHKPLVDEPTFERVQQVFQERYLQPLRGRTTVGFPLKGLAICCRCRGHMTAERHGRFGYYRCSRKANRTELCDARYCRADRAHADVVRVLRTLQIGREFAADIREQATLLLRRDRDSADALLQKSNRVLAGLSAAELALSEAFVSGDISPSQYRYQTDALRLKRQRLERTARTHADPATREQSMTKSLALCTSMFDIYDSLNEVRRAELLKAVFATTVLGADGLAGFTLKAPFEQFHRGGSPKAIAAALIEAA
jgi:DNA invertase Pin-like site-specific DNA recombinase